MAKLKPKWMKTDMPKGIKIKLWRIMKDNPTYKAWEKMICGKSYTTAQDNIFTEDELEFVNMSRDAYRGLQYEVKHMPSEEVANLPTDIKLWIHTLRPELQSKKSSVIDLANQENIYEETLHKQKIRDLARRLKEEIELPLIWESFVFKSKVGRYYLRTSSFSIEISPNGKVEPRLNIEEDKEIKHLYDGLLNHLETDDFSEVVTKIDSEWRKGIGQYFRRCQNLLQEVQNKADIEVSSSDDEEPGFISSFLITICSSAVFICSGFPLVQDLSYSYERTPRGLWQLKYGSWGIYIGRLKEELGKYEKLHKDLRNEWKTNRKVKNIVKLRQDLGQIIEDINQKLSIFVDKELLPGKCPFCIDS